MPASGRAKGQGDSAGLDVAERPGPAAPGVRGPSSEASGNDIWAGPLEGESQCPAQGHEGPAKQGEPWRAHHGPRLAPRVRGPTGLPGHRAVLSLGQGQVWGVRGVAVCPHLHRKHKFASDDVVAAAGPATPRHHTARWLRRQCCPRDLRRRQKFTPDVRARLCLIATPSLPPPQGHPSLSLGPVKDHRTGLRPMQSRHSVNTCCCHF